MSLTQSEREALDTILVRKKQRQAEASATCDSPAEIVCEALLRLTSPVGDMKTVAWAKPKAFDGRANSEGVLGLARTKELSENSPHPYDNQRASQYTEALASLPAVPQGAETPFLWVCPNCFHQSHEPGKHVSSEYERENMETGARGDLCDHEMIALYTHPAPSPALSEGLTEAARDVLAERERQKSVEGWTTEHDDEHDDGSLEDAAACYIMEAGLQAIGALPRTKPPAMWPWDAKWWKPRSVRENLVRGGALVQAALERIDRLSAPTQPEAL